MLSAAAYLSLSVCPSKTWTHWNLTRSDMTDSHPQETNKRTFGKTQINLFLWWSLAHWWLWLMNLIFLFSKHWLEPNRRVTQQHTSRKSRGCEEFMAHFWSQAVSLFSRAWKSNCDRFSWKNANLWGWRQDLFWSAGFCLLILRDLIWCESRQSFWRCVVSCQVDKCVIVCCLTLFSKWCIGY